MDALTAQGWAFAASLALIAGLEALPAWGRWVPGHYGIGLVMALAIALDAAPWWIGFAALAGAFVSDVAVFLYEERLRLVSPHGHGAWWRAGLDMDDLVQWIRAQPLRTFALAKLSTKHRARLPSGAARMQMPL